MLEWDYKKAASNLRKHGVDFDEAASCFDDPDVLMFHDVPHSAREDRYAAVAKSNRDRLLTMVFTIRRTKDGKKIYRIISARHASKKDRKDYSR